MRGSARIYDVRMAQFVLKIEKLSHIMGPRASQDLRSPSPIMAPDTTQDTEVSIKLTLFENIPAPLLQTVAEAIVSPTSCLFSVETGFIM